MERSYDPELLRAASGEYQIEPDEETWLGIKENVMLVDGEDIGLATFDYPGLYCCHWFMKSKGRAALDVAIRGLDVLFRDYGAEAIRGITHVDHKAAKYMSKRLGFERVSIEEFTNGPHELVILHKDKFYRDQGKINGLHG